jgi:hypothetical protein
VEGKIGFAYDSIIVIMIGIGTLYRFIMIKRLYSVNNVIAGNTTGCNIAGKTCSINGSLVSDWYSYE